MYGLRFGHRRDSYGPVRTCCLLIKCKRAASLSLDSPLHSPSPRRRWPPPFRSAPPRPLAPCIREPEAALVSRRNQPRPDNNEIHKSVREHGTPPRRAFGNLALALSLSLFPLVSLSRPLAVPFRNTLCLSTCRVPFPCEPPPPPPPPP